MTESEKLLVEAIKSMLSGKTKLGLSFAGKEADPDDSNSAAYLYNDLEDRFRVKVSGLTHYDGICAAFGKIHSYKTVDDGLFSRAFVNELNAMGVPGGEVDEAVKVHSDLAKSLKGDNERDAGWNPNLDEVMATAGK